MKLEQSSTEAGKTVGHTQGYAAPFAGLSNQKLPNIRHSQYGRPRLGSVLRRARPDRSPSSQKSCKHLLSMFLSIIPLQDVYVRFTIRTKKFQQTTGTLALPGVNLQLRPKSMIFRKFFSMGSWRVAHGRRRPRVKAYVPLTAITVIIICVGCYYGALHSDPAGARALNPKSVTLTLQYYPRRV